MSSALAGRATRILLADDHEMVRRGIRMVIESQADWEVCGEAADGVAAVALAAELAPDIVVIDVSMPGLNGLEAMRQIRAAGPKIEMLALSMHESRQIVDHAIDAGARGYVLKSDAGGELVAAVEALKKHEYFISPRLTQLFPDAWQSSPGRRRLKSAGALTGREMEILRLLSEGCTNKGVAVALGISVKTAETHRARIMRKLRVDSVADLVRYAIRNGLIQA